MGKKLINKKTTVLGILLFALIILSAIFLNYQPAVLSSLAPTPAVREQTINTDFAYRGQAGLDALTILKQKTNVEQDKSGMVVSINSRKADGAKHEYWAFYINGKLASVGPADYQTKNTDTIKWKIETY